MLLSLLTITLPLLTNPKFSCNLSSEYVLTLLISTVVNILSLVSSIFLQDVKAKNDNEISSVNPIIKYLNFFIKSSYVNIFNEFLVFMLFK